MRRAALALVLLVLAAGSLATAAGPVGPDPHFVTPGSLAMTIDMKTTLQKGLKARTPEEFEFIDRVVALVEMKALPISLVQSTYTWARRVPRIPMPYFQRALRLRAKRLGVEI